MKNFTPSVNKKFVLKDLYNIPILAVESNDYDKARLNTSQL